jgi:hypothetical protein
MSRCVTLLGAGVLAIAAAAIVAGCASSRSISYSGVSGLHGVVMRGPTEPVCVQGAPCSKPAAGVTLRFVRHHHVAARARVRESGSYSVRLAPGIYTVLSAPRSSIGTGVRPHRVRVFIGPPRQLDFFIDTGIR